MPKGIPVATVAIGDSGAVNAALLAASILSSKYPMIKDTLLKFRNKQTIDVLKSGDPKE